MNCIPDTLYIERGVIDHSFTKKILSRLNSVPVVLIDDYKKIGEHKTFTVRADEDKNSLALAYKKGDLIKNIGRMESSQYYLFHEIDCRYDCEYCYLQYYFQTKAPVIFVNRDEIVGKIEEILMDHPNPYFHVGEVCDALAFDELTGFSLELAELFKRYQNGKVEFRTKSTYVDNLLSVIDPTDNIIPSWTLSPERVASSIEHKTPSFIERLEAAKKCQNSGYTVGVRLDPIIIYEGWESDYRELLNSVFTVLEAKRIDYISLGTIKLHKILLDTIKERFPRSPVVLGEIFPSSDGKYRNLKYQRVDLYRKLVSWIREWDSEIEIALSIESDEVNDLVFG